MTPEQALSFLFQMTSAAPLPLNQHLQARQAYEVILNSLKNLPTLREVKKETKDKKGV